MNKIVLSLTALITSAFALNHINEADCLIIEEENSIICKYSAVREIEDKFVHVEWIDPQGNVSRARKILMPKGHGSIYDFRYIKGRMPGIWTFKVQDKETTYSTEFELKAAEK